MSTTAVVPPPDILQFEAQWPRHSAAKEAAIAERWEMTAVRYYQVLARVSASPTAVASDPFLVARIRRQRAGRMPLLGESDDLSPRGSVASSGGFELPA